LVTTAIRSPSILQTVSNPPRSPYSLRSDESHMFGYFLSKNVGVLNLLPKVTYSWNVLLFYYREVPYRDCKKERKLCGIYLNYCLFVCYWKMLQQLRLYADYLLRQRLLLSNIHLLMQTPHQQSEEKP